MSGKRISLVDGFEDLLGTLRALSGEYPSRGEMRSVSGRAEGVSETYYSAMITIGEQVFNGVKSLDDRLQKIEEAMTAAVREQKEVDAVAAETLNSLLADLESMRGEDENSAPKQNDAGMASRDWQL
ncbi:hypothetical protein ACFWHR_03540 [Leucobacter sp. NPDC058333]|uniref:hypothetical protein n=1 Tax=Leucobacter sp. NPDC058333 TaxID=3346450 RepID=UPI0036579C5A